MNCNGKRIQIGDRVSIYKRGAKGLYNADFHYGGRHRRRSLKTSNLRIATQLALKLACQIQEGVLEADRSAPQVPAVCKTTLDTARNAFIDFHKAEGRAPKTTTKYDGTLRSFVAFAETNNVRRVDQVTLTLVDEFRFFRSQQLVRGKAIGDTQKHHDVSLLKRFFAWCADRQMTPASPLATQKPPRRNLRRKEQVLTIEQLERILAELPARLFGPVAVLAFTGMRSSNCRQLLVEDVDLENGWIYVRSRLGAKTKSNNEWKAPIHPRLAKILTALPKTSRGYLFTAPASRKYPSGGHWINTKHLNDDFVALLKKLAIPAGCETGFTIHSLRHFFKSFCISHGVPREYVDAWQGHSAIRSASDLYVHTFDSESQRLIRKVPFGDGVSAPDAEQI